MALENAAMDAQSRHLGQLSWTLNSTVGQPYLDNAKCPLWRDCYTINIA